MPVASKAPHWQAVRATKKIAFMAARSSTRGLWQPSGWALRGGRNCSISSQSSSGMRQPSSLVTSPIKSRSPFLPKTSPSSAHLSRPSEIGSKPHLFHRFSSTNVSNRRGRVCRFPFPLWPWCFHPVQLPTGVLSPDYRSCHSHLRCCLVCSTKSLRQGPQQLMVVSRC